MDLVEPDPQLAQRIRDFVEAHRDDAPGEVATEVVFENDRVRIWRLDLEPGEASDLHHHALDYMVIVVDGDLIAGVPAPDTDTPQIVVRVQPGTTEFVPRGGTEWAFNLGEKTYREILIELKDRPPPRER